MSYEVMESFDIYEDMSLFNGDLLLEDVTSEHLPTVVSIKPVAQDGSPVINASSIQHVKQISVHDTLAHPQFGSNDLGLADLVASSPTTDLPDPFSSSTTWMDTNTDLLDLLSTDPLTAESSIASHQLPTPTVTLLCPNSPGTPPAVVPELSFPSNAESLEVFQGLLCMDLAAPPPEIMLAPVAPTDQDMDLLGELNEAGLEELLSSNITASSSILDAPILSPVSADDVESLLSSSPPSPSQDTSLSSLFSSFTEASSFEAAASESYEQPDDVYLSDGGPQRSVKQRPAPYSKGTRKARNGDRKERKKEQNRTAALRYREKKRGETCVVQEEADELEEKNKKLRDQVDSMTREIKYLKDLMVDVLKARSKAKKSP